jgi:hypothetical protein
MSDGAAKLLVAGGLASLACAAPVTPIADAPRIQEATKPADVGATERSAVEIPLLTRAENEAIAVDFDGPPVSSCLGSVPDADPRAPTLSPSFLLDHSARWVGKRVLVKGILSVKRGRAEVTSFDGAHMVGLAVEPVPASIAGCAGEACVVVEATVVKPKAPAASPYGEGYTCLLDGMPFLTAARVAAVAHSCETPPLGPLFARSLADAALADIASTVDVCKQERGPTGPGYVFVRFSPSGDVALAWVEPPYAGTVAGGCIAKRFREARVPPFMDDPHLIHKRFVLQ